MRKFLTISLLLLILLAGYAVTVLAVGPVFLARQHAS